MERAIVFRVAAPVSMSSDCGLAFAKVAFCGNCGLRGSSSDESKMDSAGSLSRLWRLVYDSEPFVFLGLGGEVDPGLRHIEERQLFVRCL